MMEMKSKLMEAYNILVDRGYTVLYIGYYGAHNYNLNGERSDYDFKAIVLPSLKQLIKRDVISLTSDFDFGGIDIKDLITFTSNMNKGNFSYIEALKTPYKIDMGKELLGVSVQELFKDVRVNYMSMVGAIHEKRKAMEHEYPSKVEEFEQFGCDPKQFLQAIRLFDILRDRSMSEDPELFNLAFKTYDSTSKDIIQFELRKFESEASSRKYEFTYLDLIDMKRKLVMPLDETIRMFDYVCKVGRELLPKDYKFQPLDYTDQVIDLLVEYFNRVISTKSGSERKVALGQELGMLLDNVDCFTDKEAK